MKTRFITLVFVCWATCACAHEFVGQVSPINAHIQSEMQEYKTYIPTCPVHPHRLSEVTYSYYDFDGKVHDDGTLVVMDATADNVLQIMHELYRMQFPINKSQRIEFYAGSDDRSMEDNNSSSFNCREITNKPGIFSLHSYGVAIDINPVQNPYIGKFDMQTGAASVSPSAGLNYLNRANIRPGMAEPVVAIFAKHGFSVWGGTWNDRIDWQHFQTSRPAANLLAAMQPDDAKEFFAMYAKNPQLFNALPGDNADFVTLYQQDPHKFMRQFRANYSRLNGMPYEAAVSYFKIKFSK